MAQLVDWFGDRENPSPLVKTADPISAVAKTVHERQPFAK